MEENKKVVLDKSRKMIAGVGSGIAEYLDVDPTFVRIVLLYVLFNVGLVWGLVFYGLTYWMLYRNGEDRVTGTQSNNTYTVNESETSYYEKEDTYEEPYEEQEEFELDDIMVVSDVQETEKEIDAQELVEDEEEPTEEENDLIKEDNQLIVEVWEDDDEDDVEDGIEDTEEESGKGTTLEDEITKNSNELR